jgi:heme/copper-type cytochrome/quinol oxidase subunit 3
MSINTAMHPAESSEFVGTLRGKLAMWLFLISDALTFGALLAVYGTLRMGNPSWPTPADHLGIPLTALNTFILICSSVTMVKALSAVRHGDQKKFQQFLIGTIIGGSIFLGIQAYEYTHLITHQGMALRKDLFSATFFMITGFHGMHVFGGVVYLFVILMQARRGIYTAHNNERVEIAGLYWHFVDLVWILVFTFVYLI